jgi:hypothetical protein
MTMPKDPLSPLRDAGQRYWRRFSPPSDLPARVAIVTATGRIGERRVYDFSLGGVGLALKWRDPRSLEIGVPLHIELSLMGGVPVHLQARCMHLQKKKDGLFSSWVAGLQFENNAAFARAKPIMARYLLRVARRADAEAAAAAK